jgi:hypothetical protein
MGFFDSLAANPGGSGIYGSTGAKEPDFGVAMNIDAEMRRRKLNDIAGKQKLDFDMQVKQNRLNSIYGDNPVASANNFQMAQNNQGRGGVPLSLDPDRITPFQREGLDLKREDLANDRSKIALTSRMGQERTDLGEEKHKLDVEKNKNIFETKQSDMQRKHDEAQDRLKLAQDALEQKGNNANTQAELHRAQIDASNARHELDLHRRDSQLEETKRLHDAQIAAMQEKLDQAANTSQTAELATTPEGNTRRTINTKKGSKKPGDSLGIR